MNETRVRVKTNKAQETCVHRACEEGIKFGVRGLDEQEDGKRKGGG